MTDTKQNARRRLLDGMRRLAISVWQRDREANNRLRAHNNRPGPIELSKQDCLNKMTNWQLTQCLRQCKGDVKNLSLEKAKYWLSAPHWKKAGHAHDRSVVDVEAAP